ncbi:hypothetical protein HYW36_01835 [Candidatus Saccharibacteria bacterium]|nr:hypothetical protein [Candidatus Saccharibacteria bacterium]
MQKINSLTIVAITALSLGGLFFAPSAIADELPTKLDASDCKIAGVKESGVSEKGPLAGKACKKLESDCPSGKVSKEDDTKCLPLGSNPVELQDNPIVKKINDVVNVLSGLVGVVVVGMIILGGIQFAMAGDKSEAVSAAKQRIINGLIALIAFLFIFAFIQWLVPGGVFK